MNNLDYLVPTVIPIARNKAMIMHMKNNSKHCLNQKDETCPKDSKDVENHAFSE